MGRESAQAMGATLTLYPARRRCVTCRRYFAGLVLAGQYCSYRCAGVDRPAPRAQDWRWPRHHFRRGYGTYRRIEKTFYLSQAEADLAAMSNDSGGLTSYLCDYCLMWHNGHVDENSTSGVDSLP
jgi:hypothetical protein